MHLRPHLMKISASVFLRGRLFPCESGQSKMNLRKLSPLILKICVALIAVALLFSAPASHAAHKPCSTETNASVRHVRGGNNHSKEEAALGDQTRCSSICAICLLIIPSPTEMSSVSILLSQISDLQNHLIGRAPSPSLRPPKSAA